MTTTLSGFVREAQVVRITRLNADGSIMAGPSASIVLNCFTKLQAKQRTEKTPDYESVCATGIKITKKGKSYSDGGDVEITFPSVNADLYNLLTGGQLIQKDGDRVGFMAPPQGVVTEQMQNGHCIELFRQVDNPDGSLAGYTVMVLPRVQGLMAEPDDADGENTAGYTFTGGNAIDNQTTFGDGPFGLYSAANLNVTAPTWYVLRACTSADIPVAAPTAIAVPATTP